MAIAQPGRRTADQGQPLAVVSGGSSGIGEAVAKLYGARGARVALIGRDADRLERAVRAVGEAGGTASAYRADLANPTDVASIAARIESDHGAPDILIHCAGAGRWLPLTETSAEDAQAMVAVPYLAAFNLTRALLPGMIARRRGQIAFVSSPGSYITWPNAAAYLASRHALKGLAEGLRAELKVSGVGVTLAVLGEVETAYWTHNPGSRRHVPRTSRRLASIMTADEAAAALVSALDRRSARLVKPALLRLIFILDTLVPGLVAKQMRRAGKAG